MPSWENISSVGFSPQNFMAKSQGQLATFGDDNDLGNVGKIFF
jgi:hypothetical protein